jgi:peptidyl-tRNA hydrolase
MTVTTRHLTRAAAACAVAAGAIFVAVQINHPPSDTFLTDTHEWVIRGTAKAVMAVLALAGITGMYLRQVRQMRVLGLVGFVVFVVGYLFVFATEITSVLVLPALTEKAPVFVNDVVLRANGGKATGDLGHVQILLDLMGVGYVLGGLIFGLALFRARVLARWAALLLAASTTATVALAVLPESFNRPMAVPEGVALIALGISLWRDQSATTETPAPLTAAVERLAVR